MCVFRAERLATHLLRVVFVLGGFLKESILSANRLGVHPLVLLIQQRLMKVLIVISFAPLRQKLLLLVWDHFKIGVLPTERAGSNQHV